MDSKTKPKNCFLFTICIFMTQLYYCLHLLHFTFNLLLKDCIKHNQSIFLKPFQGFFRYVNCMDLVESQYQQISCGTIVMSLGISSQAVCLQKTNDKAKKNLQFTDGDIYLCVSTEQKMQLQMKEADPEPYTFKLQTFFFPNCCA